MTAFCQPLEIAVLTGQETIVLLASTIPTDVAQQMYDSPESFGINSEDRAVLRELLRERLGLDEAPRGVVVCSSCLRPAPACVCRGLNRGGELK